MFVVAALQDPQNLRACSGPSIVGVSRVSALSRRSVESPVTRVNEICEGARALSAKFFSLMATSQS